MAAKILSHRERQANNPTPSVILSQVGSRGGVNKLEPIIKSQILKTDFDSKRKSQSVLPGMKEIKKNKDIWNNEKNQ